MCFDDVNYVNSVDVIDNYITIMMNDKYGLYLIPKVLTSDNFSNINLNGKYNIEVRNNYAGSEQYDILKTYIDYVEPTLDGERVISVQSNYRIIKIDDVSYEDVYYRLIKRNGTDEILVREDILDRSKKI